MVLKRKVAFATSLIVAGLVIGLILASNLNIQNQSVAQSKEVAPRSKAILEQFSNALAEVTDVARPAVVNISTMKTVEMKDNPMGRFFDDPFFRRFFGDENQFHSPKKHESKSLGSGVIVLDDGYILTNSHVVKDVDEIKVILYDKTEYKGKVIGTDSKSDLAVIKIEAKDLPTIKIGDSSKLKPGEIIIAIGNPFGLNQTVTMGIVSAVGRSDVGIADYEDFIQIDAAINPGNSGGALVSINGELVGINTAIFSTSGGYQGIGFAIPTNMAKSVMDSLMKKGKVVRGWLGVNIQPLTPELSKSFGLTEKTGVLIADVVDGGPADKAGIKRGDVIVMFNGKESTSTRQLRNMVSAIDPGTTVDVKVIRETKEVLLGVKVGELPDDKTAAMLPSAQESETKMRGISVQNLAQSLRERFNIPAKVNGVIVTGVDEDSVAASILRPGDIIGEVNRKRVSNVSDYETAISTIKKDDDVLLLVYRSGAFIYVTLSSKK
ncbi:DegQ family serine endoprotease [Candidatus Magnetobacterium casense]|uniref:DegQ family serine endoprotease n=1 Tax=Candidatus Magnetobacterium casense TaxID=1455061 RepID=A0ABS6RXL1_9BACT|nr:DegQ family serine endoprotease [Candidatus Magnetobacterium casensis]MBV6341372.1 DegQ family serine endoprotease [Candidatus Magnetobacterium casensis]